MVEAAGVAEGEEARLRCVEAGFPEEEAEGGTWDIRAGRMWVPAAA
jgi:hypothetical protein